MLSTPRWPVGKLPDRSRPADAHRRPSFDFISTARFTAAVFLALVGTAYGQAWVPPAGVGSVDVVYQVIDNTGHLLTDGSRLDDGKSTNMGVQIEAGYAFTDRVSVSLGVPYVFSKYVGPGPTPFSFLPVDACRCWHSGLQDFSLTARYNIINGAVALTPSVSVGVPSHAYDFRGEAVIGRRLRETRIALDAGVRLDAISPRLSLQGRYSYAIVEQVLGIANNRSNVAIEGGFLATRRLSVQGSVLLQRTHGGLRLGSFPPADLVLPGEVDTADRILQHDRLLRDNHLWAGAGLAYSFPRFDVFASYIGYVSGTDAHAGRALSTGISWPFEIARGAARP